MSSADISNTDREPDPDPKNGQDCDGEACGAKTSSTSTCTGDYNWAKEMQKKTRFYDDGTMTYFWYDYDIYILHYSN